MSQHKVDRHGALEKEVQRWAPSKTDKGAAQRGSAGGRLARGVLARVRHSESSHATGRCCTIVPSSLEARMSFALEQLTSVATASSYGQRGSYNCKPFGAPIDTGRCAQAAFASSFQKRLGVHTQVYPAGVCFILKNARGTHPGVPRLLVLLPYTNGRGNTSRCAQAALASSFQQRRTSRVPRLLLLLTSTNGRGNTSRCAQAAFPRCIQVYPDDVPRCAPGVPMCTQLRENANSEKRARTSSRSSWKEQKEPNRDADRLRLSVGLGLGK